MTFPTTRLGLQVELAMNGVVDYTDNPMNWPWVDQSDRLLAQGISFSQGTENEAQGLQPATCTFELSTRDGLLLPSNPASVYWPHLRRGTPVRITTEGAAKAAWLPGGAGNYWSSPHVAADNISGDIDIRVYVDPDRWSDKPASWHQHLCGIMGTTTGSLQWTLDLFQYATPAFSWSTDGNLTTNTAWCRNAMVAMRPAWLGFTLDANDGSGNYVGKFYRWDGDSPPADITTWTLIDVVADLQGLAPIHTGSTSDLIIGGDFSGRVMMRGRFFNLQVRNGINGTLVANPDFTARPIGNASFTDSTGRTWNAHGLAEVSTKHTRFAGSVDSIVVSWPYGNHNAAVEDTHPSECRVTITASDVVRRLGQGAQPTQSTLRRRLGFPVSDLSRDEWGMIAYWPCEEPQGAAALGSGLPGATAMQTYGITAGQDGSLVSSDPLAVMPADGASGWTGEVPANGWESGWEVVLVFRGDEGPADPPRCGIFTVRCGGTVESWSISLTASGFHLRAFSGGAQVVTEDQGYPASFWGPWIMGRLTLRQNAGNIDWEASFVNLDDASANIYSGSVAGTLGVAQLVQNSLQVGDAPKGLSFGHVAVAPDVFGSISWLAGHDTSWAGETTAARIFRLCKEEGLVAEIVGDPTIGLFPPLRGSMDWSQPLGYQAQDTFLGLLDKAAAVDRGVLASRRTHPGFVYRTRQTMDNQPVRMVLDASTNAVTIPLEPTLDDQRIRNDVTVGATRGASAREVDQASIDTEGRYQVAVEVNGVGGLTIQPAIVGRQPGLDLAMAYQNHHLAGWLLTLGTQTDLRFPRIMVDFGLAPQLLDDWCALRLGDRIQLQGLPIQYPGTVELIVEYMEDLMSPTAWVGVLVGTPGAPYMMGVLDA